MSQRQKSSQSRVNKSRALILLPELRKPVKLKPFFPCKCFLIVLFKQCHNTRSRSILSKSETLLKTPMPTRASKNAVHNYAEKLAEKLDFEPGASLQALIKKLGGRLEISDPFAEDIDESMHVKGKRNFTIYISNFTSDRRDRFTIAHELGHYLLHYPPILKDNPKVEMKATRWVDETDKDQMRAEWEANWFAAAFLMPEKAFRAKYGHHVDIGEIADHFKVSVSAAKIRAQSLGLDIAD